MSVHEEFCTQLWKKGDARLGLRVYGFTGLRVYGFTVTPYQLH